MTHASLLIPARAPTPHPAWDRIGALTFCALAWFVAFKAIDTGVAALCSYFGGSL